jgi:AraC-like DNA-binding protein
VVFFVLIIGFFGINQYPVFSSIPVSYGDAPQPSEEVKTFPLILKDTPAEEEKYTKSGLSDEKASDVMHRLEQTMKARQPFRNPNLTLDELAGSVQVSPNHLSQVINAVSGKTFYNYINSYRIDEFVRIAALPENRKFTYLGLAYRCGFSSKTTFNKYFKLQTGKTPSEYFGLEKNVR